MQFEDIDDQDGLVPDPQGDGDDDLRLERYQFYSDYDIETQHLESDLEDDTDE